MFQALMVCKFGGISHLSLVASGFKTTTKEQVASTMLGRSNDCLSVLQKASPVMG